MAEGRVRLTRLHGGDEAALLRDVGMANCIDAIMNAVKPAVSLAPPDPVTGQAARNELAEVKDAFGFGCHRRHAPIRPSVVIGALYALFPSFGVGGRAWVGDHQVAARHCDPLLSGAC